MSVRSDIQDGTRAAVSEIAIGEGWEYRKLTSTPGVSTRTYGAWTALAARRRNARRSQEYQGGGSAFVQVEFLTLTLYVELDLTPGDQVRDPTNANAAWAFESEVERGIGIIVNEFKRELSLVASADRGGDV